MALQPTTHPQAEQQVGATEADRADWAKTAVAPRYNIILRIRHPELDPAEITAALGWKPQHSWKAGDRAVTPKGTKLPGVRSDGLWSCTFQGKSGIAAKFDEILGHLSERKKLFDKLNEMQAQSALYLQLPGDTNIGDRIPWEVLKKFADLKIAFEFEAFPEWS